MTVGSHTITAVYSGDANFATSTSPVVTQVVNKGTSTTTIVSSENPSSPGDVVTFTVTVTGSTPPGTTPTGNVGFRVNGALIGQFALVNGSFTVMQTFTAVGTYHIVANYHGDSDYAISTGTLTQTVETGAVATDTSVVSSMNPAVANTSVTFVATVTVPPPGMGMPSGTVQFLDGGNVIGSGVLNGSGQASFSTSSLGAGSHSITAQYLGSNTFASSVSPILTQVITSGDTATATFLSSNVNPAVVGQTITFSANVTSKTGIPTGTVNFFENGTTLLGSAGLDINGNAVVMISTLPEGTFDITAVYAGDSTFASSISNIVVQVVNLIPVVTTVTADINPSSVGQLVTFTATIVPVVTTTAGAPTGTVEFFDGMISLGVVDVIPGMVNSTAILATSTLTQGSHNITAAYSGDTTYDANTSDIYVQVVNANVGTTTSLNSTPNPSTVTQTVTLTATVTPTGATGSIEFLNGATVLGTVQLSGGMATLMVSFPNVGTFPLQAEYIPDPGFVASNSPIVNQIVNAGNTMTTLVSSPNPSMLTQNVTLTATVAPVAPSTNEPMGTVTFFNGGTIIGMAALSAGVAILNTTTLPVGSNDLIAVYSGDDNDNGSTSNVVTQVVNQGNTVNTLVVTSTTAVVGTTITFTSTVTAVIPSAQIPTSTVTILANGVAIATSPLVNGVAVFSSDSLPAGTYNVISSYSGDTNFAGSISNMVTLTILGITSPTTTTLTSLTNPSWYGQLVTFTAAVIPAIASGTVTFFVDGRATATVPVVNGIAVYSVATLTPGYHNVYAVYNGSTSFEPSTSNIVVQIVMFCCSSL